MAPAKVNRIATTHSAGIFLSCCTNCEHIPENPQRTAPTTIYNMPFSIYEFITPLIAFSMTIGIESKHKNSDNNKNKTYNIITCKMII